MTAAITIVGLGPGPADLRTMRAQRALDAARIIFIRDHEGTDFTDILSRPNTVNLASYRAQATDRERRWYSSAQAVVDEAAKGPVVVAIPGHPRYGELLVIETVILAQQQNLEVDILDGLSMIDLLCTALDIDPVRQRVQLMDGRDISLLQNDAPFDGGELNASPHLPMLITHVYNNEIMRDLSTQLRRILPPDHPLTLISHAGLSNQTTQSLTLHELADHSGNPMLGIYVPALGELTATRAANSLQHIMARLRREDGCPWDRKQTNSSLAPTLADEVYEIIDAINAEDDANICEELGDLLMLIMMHAQIAEERCAFTLEDVYHGIVTKIVRRHPHVFGDDAATNAEEVVGLWQRVKAEEKKANPKPEKADDGQPHSMPALDRAVRVLKKHPLEVAQPSSADDRQRGLLNAVAAIIAAGDDPNEVLKSALIDHVNAGNAASEER